MPLLTAPSTFRLGEYARVLLSSFIDTTSITLDASSWYYLTTQDQNANKVLFSFAMGTCIARGVLGLPASNDEILQASKIGLSLKDQQISNTDTHENRDRDRLYDIRCMLHTQYVDCPQSKVSVTGNINQPSTAISQKYWFYATTIFGHIARTDDNHTTGYASQHIWCLSQARIKWEGCGRKGIRRKNGGMTEMGHWLVWMKWRPVGWSVRFPLLSVLALCTYGWWRWYQDDSNGSPPVNWKRPPGRHCITWLNTVQRDLRAYNFTLNEALDLAQNRPLWRLISTYGATHSQWCMPEKKKTSGKWSTTIARWKEANT